MRWRGPVVAFVAFVAFAGVAHAAPELTLDRIVARHVAARGGLEKIRAIETLRQKGRVIAGPGREALVTREISRPTRTRFEFTMQGVTAVFESDGKRGFKVDPFEGSMDPTPLSDEVVAEAAEQTDLEGPLVDWKAKGHWAELLGRTIVGDREAYEIRLTLASGAERREFVDAKSFLLTRSQATRHIRGRPVEITTTYGDFKKTKGVVFPRTIEVEATGRPSRVLVVVDAIEVNPASP